MLINELISLNLPKPRSPRFPMIKYKIMMIDGKLYNFGGISGNRLAGISNNSYETKEEAVSQSALT